MVLASAIRLSVLLTGSRRYRSRKTEILRRFNEEGHDLPRTVDGFVSWFRGGLEAEASGDGCEELPALEGEGTASCEGWEAMKVEDAKLLSAFQLEILELLGRIARAIEGLGDDV